MFEFYYQTGEFASSSNELMDFLKDAAVQFLGTMLAGIIALALYFQGKEDQRLKEELQQIEKHVDNLRYFAFLLRDSITVIESISETFYKVSDDLNSKIKSPDFNFTFPYESITRIARTMNQQEMYHSYQNALAYYNFTTDRKSVSKIFQIIDVVYINLPSFKNDYIEHNTLFVNTHNQIIDKILEQNKLITQLWFNGQNPKIIPLMDIITEYNQSKPETWYEACRHRQQQMNIFFNNNLTGNFEMFKPVSDLYTDISQLLLKFDAYHKTFQSWAGENAQDMYKYGLRLKRYFRSLDEFIKMKDMESLNREKLKTSFIRKIWRDVKDLFTKDYYTTI